MNTSLLYFSGVTLRRDGIAVLDGMSMGVPGDSLTGLLGQNGAGKSTLLDIASGRLAPDGGSIRFDGDEIAGLPAPLVASRGLARVWRYPLALPGMTAVEQVMAGGFLRRRTGFWSSLFSLPEARRAAAVQERQARSLLARVGLAERADHPAVRLRRLDLLRLEIARALAASPRLLLLDEPDAGLRAEDSATLGQLLRTLRADGLTLLVASHAIAFVAAHCDHAVVLDHGNVVAAGRPATCLERPIVREALLGRQQDADRLRARR